MLSKSEHVTCRARSSSLFQFAGLFGSLSLLALLHVVMRYDNTDRHFKAQFLKEEQHNQSRATTTFSTSFTFPSVEERVKYYMGDWYNRTISNDTHICGLVNPASPVCGSDAIYSMRDLERIQKSKPYFSDSISVLSHMEEVNEDDLFIIMHCGDTVSKSKQVPAVNKARPALNSPLYEKTGVFPIIWPLTVGRHLDHPLKLLSQAKKTPWERKKSSIIFRGACTGDNKFGIREATVQRYYQFNASDIDVGYSHCKKQPLQYLVKDSKSIEEQVRHKYILSLEGNDVASGLKWQLASNSVVFKTTQQIYTAYAMEDLLVPFVHYVPLNQDLSNMEEMLVWARENDDKCRWISQQATAFMDRLWLSERARLENSAIMKELATRYHEQIGKSLKSCVDRQHNDKQQELGSQVGIQRNKTKIEDGKEKHFVIHMGPAKTATTSLQLIFRRWERSYLEEDGYRYYGKKPTPLLDSIGNRKCRKMTKVALARNVSMPECWNDLVLLIQEAKGHHALMSNENFSTERDQGFMNDDNIWWEALSRVLEENHFQLVVVVSYRRLFEWLPSVNNELNQGADTRKDWNLWPADGGREVIPVYPWILHNADCHIDAEIYDPWKKTFTHTKHTFDSVPDGVADKRILNLHGPHSTQTKFFCDMLPDAPISCVASLKAEEVQKEEPHQNVASISVLYDYLCCAAAKQGLIDTAKYSRTQIKKAAQNYHALKSDSLEFPWDCPSPEELRFILDCSLHSEAEVVPEIHDVEGHTEAFWAAANQGRYCWINSETALQQSGWKEFFRRYQS